MKKGTKSRIIKGRARPKKAKGRAHFRLTKALDEEPKRVRHEDKCRHIRDQRRGRTHLALCGCEMNEQWGREPLDPTASDDLDYLIEFLRGCQMCLKIWIKRFM